MKQAVCALIKLNDRYLMVSRKNNPNDWGLPAGKCEPGESLEESIKREVMEETGLLIEVVAPVFVDVCRGDVDYITTVFDVNVIGEVSWKEDGAIRYSFKDEVCSGPFAEFNKRMFKQIERKDEK